MTFEEFMATRLPALLNFAAVLAGNRATAEDLAQDVLAKAYTRWDRIGGLDRPDLYVRKMILNEFLSWRRRSWRLVPVADTWHSGSVPDHAQQHSERDALLAEIGKLTRRQRAVLVLRYYEDRGDAEIAELLGCAPATVRAYASRGLAALRIEMRPAPPSAAGAAPPRAGRAPAIPGRTEEKS
jgi:RNA polymerase sigma-70 factor (sigma-E family)